MAEGGDQRAEGGRDCNLEAGEIIPAFFLGAPGMARSAVAGAVNR